MPWLEKVYFEIKLFKSDFKQTKSRFNSTLTFLVRILLLNLFFIL